MGGSGGVVTNCFGNRVAHLSYGDITKALTMSLDARRERPEDIPRSGNDRQVPDSQS